MSEMVESVKAAIREACEVAGFSPTSKGVDAITRAALKALPVPKEEMCEAGTEILSISKDDFEKLPTNLWARPIYMDWLAVAKCIWPSPPLGKRYRVFIQDKDEPPSDHSRRMTRHERKRNEQHND